MKRSPLLVATLTAAAIGLPLMLIFEAAWARVIGMAALVAFIVCGVFLVANPEDLAGDD